MRRLFTRWMELLDRPKENMTFTRPADPKFEQPVTQVERPSVEDIKEALGFSRTDPNVQVRMVPVPGLAKSLSGQRFNLDEFMRAIGENVTANGNVVEANIPHAGDDPANLEEVEALEEQIKKAESEERYAAGNGYAHNIANEVLEELGRAVKAHGSFQSAHEGWAVLMEEVDELWSEVKLKGGGGYTAAARKEAIQVAAVAIRFVLDLDPGEENTRDGWEDDSDTTTMDPEA